MKRNIELFGNKILTEVTFNAGNTNPVFTWYENGNKEDITYNELMALNGKVL